jgi:ABC-type uncharacterized transport system substrate-binding protein
VVTYRAGAGRGETVIGGKKKNRAFAKKEPKKHSVLTGLMVPSKMCSSSMTDDIAPAFEALKVDALYVVDNALVTANRTRIIALAVVVRLPTAFPGREFVEAGGLMSYGPDYRTLFLRAADYVDKILRGTQPGDIPVEQPTRFELVINLKTANALGLTIPHNPTRARRRGDRITDCRCR